MPVESPLPSPVERDIFRTVMPTKASAKDIHPRSLFFCHLPHRLTALKQTLMLSKSPLQSASCLPRLQGQLDTAALASGEKPLLSDIEQLSSSTGRIESVVQGLKHELLFKQQNFKPTKEMATSKQVRLQELRAHLTTQLDELMASFNPGIETLKTIEEITTS
jgi:hypothetical protein